MGIGYRLRYVPRVSMHARMYYTCNGNTLNMDFSHMNDLYYCTYSMDLRLVIVASRVCLLLGLALMT